MTTPMLNCDEAQALLPDLLDATLGERQRAQFEAHAAGCASCRALVDDLVTIRDNAAALPTFSPSRDLWSGIESRIATPVLSMDEAPRRAMARWSTRQLAVAAAVLVAVTAGGTWMTVARLGPLAAVTPSTTASGNAAGGRTDLVAVADEKGIAAYEGEIAKLRNVLQSRRGELDSATVAVLERNMKLIDAAIAESRAALAADPASTFLAGRLNHAYDTKLDLLRAAATMPSRT